MATINLDTISLPTKEVTTEIYRDIHMDLVLDTTRNNELSKKSEVRDIEADINVNAIAKSFESLLTTSPGEKILNPLFGIDFGDLLFLPVSEERAEVIGNGIITVIEKFEPRIKLVNVTISPKIESQEYIVDFIYTVPRFNNERISLKGKLSQSGFYV